MGTGTGAHLTFPVFHFVVYRCPLSVHCVHCIEGRIIKVFIPGFVETLGKDKGRCHGNFSEDAHDETHSTLPLSLRNLIQLHKSHLTGW